MTDDGSALIERIAKSGDGDLVRRLTRRLRQEAWRLMHAPLPTQHRLYPSVPSTMEGILDGRPAAVIRLARMLTEPAAAIRYCAPPAGSRRSTSSRQRATMRSSASEGPAAARSRAFAAALVR